MLFTLTILVNTVSVFSQISSHNITVNTIGLSDAYAKRFQDESAIQSFVSVWNRFVEYDTDIKITVSVSNDKGFINVAIPYNPIKHFNLRKYDEHNNTMRNMGGVGVSILLQDYICTAITEYKFAVARDGWSIDNRIMNFTNLVSLVRKNGDVLIISGYNYRNNYNGSYPFVFYTNAEMVIAGKYMNVFSTNPKALKEFKFFNWGNIYGLNGKPNAAYYMSEFFKPTKQEQAVYEAERKAKEEYEAYLRAERKRKSDELKNTCIANITTKLQVGDRLSLQLLKQNNCEIKNLTVLCRKDDIEACIGNYKRAKIAYTGGERGLLELFKFVEPGRTYQFSCDENKTLSKLFACSPSRVILDNQDKTEYGMETSFSIFPKFYRDRENIYSEVRLKVKEKAGELQFFISVPWDESSVPACLQKDAIVQQLKKVITEKGTYLFKLSITYGELSIYSFEEPITNNISCSHISIIQQKSINPIKFEYYHPTNVK
ncbi:MAG: hypothetical protein KBS95_02145 [Alistipes sp.]|nr:hypothetical protein [Candidatus Alistipes equi]